MFEAVELGRKISKKEFEQEEPTLHTQLLEVQRELHQTQIPVIIIVSGVEGAGKGGVVNRLNKWLDPRGIETYAFWEETDEERERPSYWRFWRKLPPRGKIGIMFGSWYTYPIINHVYKRIEDAEFDRKLRLINEFERMLVEDHALIVKFWFHLSKVEQKKQLKNEGKIYKSSKKKNSPPLKKFSRRYDEFAKTSERAIRMTDQGESPWHLIESGDTHYRDLSVGRILLKAIQQKIDFYKTSEKKECNTQKMRSSLLLKSDFKMPTVLDHIPLQANLSEKKYRQELQKYQEKLYTLAWAAKAKKRSSIVVFEGWDAAGKGGCIRRITAATDARLYKVISIASPTDEEKAHHYLWRFWRHVPCAGYITLYDRSWYGRVLVERVEKFAQEEEWKRSYHEINNFEEQLIEHGIIVTKFWLHLSPEEQLQRFQEREKTPWKQHKITSEDWRNREKWDDYTWAINDMISRTSTEYAPWNLIAANDKKWARVEILKTFCNRLEENL